jgi:hypothetical protein
MAADNGMQVLTLPRVAAVQSLDTPDCECVKGGGVGL